jgi:hypothetical protein
MPSFSITSTAAMAAFILGMGLSPRVCEPQHATHDLDAIEDFAYWEWHHLYFDSIL